MKKSNFKKLSVVTMVYTFVLTLITSVSTFAQINGGTLDEVVINCMRRTFSITIGEILSITLNFVAIVCDNGFTDLLWV